MRDYLNVRVVCATCFGFLLSTTGGNPQHSCFEVEKQNFFVIDCPRYVQNSGYRLCPHNPNGKGFCGLRSGCPFEHCENLEEVFYS